MAMKHGVWGKDRVSKGSSSEHFIEEALHGGSGPSEDIEHHPIGDGQVINRAYALDNVGQVYSGNPETSMKDHSGFAGGIGNLSHSLTGASAVNSSDHKIGAKGHTKDTRIKDH